MPQTDTKTDERTQAHDRGIPPKLSPPKRSARGDQRDRHSLES